MFSNKLEFNSYVIWEGLCKFSYKCFYIMIQFWMIRLMCIHKACEPVKCIILMHDCLVALML